MTDLCAQSRVRINFNPNWRFRLADDPAFRQPDFGDGDWRLVELPHDWSIPSDFGTDFPAGNARGALPGGIGWCRNFFRLAKTDSGKHVRMDLDGAYRYAEAWINGHPLGKNTNGYLSLG